MALDVNLTLSDFRSILGKVNDGNVVLTQNQSGIEKANYGNKFLNLFRSVRVAPNNPEENYTVRQALLTAIRNSSEGKVISAADMNSIRTALGIPDGVDSPQTSAPLSRRSLKAVIDIIDRATANDSLIQKDIDSLASKGLCDKFVANGVKMAMADAKCFNLANDAKMRQAQVGQLFGSDFKGRSPAEVEKFVRLNSAVIREQVFDRLYWTNPALEDLCEKEHLDDEEVLNRAFREIGESEGVDIQENTVTEMFKKVVGELMEKAASKTRVTTMAESLAPQQDAVHLADDDARSIWQHPVNGSSFLSKVDKAFAAAKSSAPVFAALQIDHAASAVKNMIISKFNQCFAENQRNAQQTEQAFTAQMQPLMTTLEGIAADLERIGPDAAGDVMAKFVDALGGKILNGGDAGTLADKALATLNDACKGFSARGMVENYVNANFAFLEDKEPVISFFMEKIGAACKDGGIDRAQLAVLSNTQKAAAAGKLDVGAKNSLEADLLNPLKDLYNKMVEEQSPEKVRELRVKRNDNTFKALVDAMPGSAEMTEAERSSALIALKLETFISMHGHDKAFALGLIDSAGSSSIKTDGGVPVQAAVDTLNEELLKLNNNDLEFFSQYSAKGLRAADSEASIFCFSLKIGAHDTIFRDALRDGTISISSIPRNAVPLLKTLINAQLFSSAAEGYYVATMRDLLPENDKSDDLATLLHNRICQRFADAGIKNPPRCMQPADNDPSESGLRLQASDRDELTAMRGFGTLDPAKLLKLFAETGIDLAALDGNDDNAKVAVFEKVISLSLIAQMSGCKLDGLPEFAERVFGKPFQDVTLADVFKLMDKNEFISGRNVESTIAVKDPIDTLSGAQKTAKQLFTGELALAEAKLSPEETTKLLATARSLASAAPGTIAGGLKIGGADVELTALKDGAISVKIGKFPMRAAFDANGLIRMIENEIVSKPNSFQKDVVTGALPSLDDVKSGEVSIIRARELYSKAAAMKTGTLPVMFSAYSTAELRDIALKAIDGKFTAKNLPSKPPATYNSGAMIEMHDNFAKTSSAVIDEKVKIATTAPRSIEDRRAIAPDDSTVRNIVADLFLNKDTWAFDAGAAGNAQPGERVRKLLVEYGPELGFILDGLGKEGEDKLAYLPANVRDAVKDVFADIKKLDIQKLANANDITDETRDALAAIEAKIDGAASRLADEMQEKVTKLFAPHDAGEVRADWQKTFAELNGKEGIDETTRQGKFTMNVLRNYFKSSAPVDKRAMLSAFIRNTGPDSTDAKQVAELLKGAGPLLQKMLQGLPLSSFDKDTQLALKDMKSRLLPIPDEAVKAQLLELVRSSNGNIRSIEVKRSLGAASVGQAFLCTVKTKEHPNIGEECVIKLLRPNVDTAVQREKAMIDKIIGDDPAMKATFDGQYRKILEEFDLTLESTNIGIGTSVYERPKGVANVHSMQTLQGSLSTTTSMILKKADGKTFDAIIDDARKEAEDILAPLRQQTDVDGVSKTVYKAKTPGEFAVARRKLMLQVAQLNDRRNHILDVAKAWFDNALFGNGFFHGDLHGGNLMTGPTGTTFIDFGNCSRLSKNDQEAMKMMLASVVSGDTDHVVSNFKKLMTSEGSAAFDRKFPAGSDAMKRLTDVLKRGTAHDLMSRVQAFIAIAQGEDVPVPASIQNFVQSYVRLSDIVADIDRNIADFQIAANSIYCDMPNAEPVEGESQAISLIKNLARAYVGNANTPYSAEAVRDAANAFATYVSTTEGKAEINSLAHDVARVRGELLPLLDVLRNAKIYTRFDTEIDINHADMPEGFRNVRAAVETVIALDDAGKIKDGVVVSEKKAELDALDGLEEKLTTCVKYSASNMIEIMGTVNSEGSSNFSNLAVKKNQSVTDVCVDVISDHQSELGGSAFSEFGILGVAGFTMRLAGAFKQSEAAATRRNNAGTALAERNRALPPGERLSGQEMATLSRATSDFLVPSPRPDATKNWGGDAGKRADMLTAIAYNLSRAEAAMKAPLSMQAVNHAALNMGLIDGQLITSISSMSESDFNMLAMEAGQTDNASGNNYLSTAIATLRGAADLLAEVSE